jgi:ceramide glucosyltransferase
MIIGAGMARGELLAFSDSDTRPDREVLRALVETLIAGEPDIGCTFAPVAVQLTGSPAAGDVGYAMMLNSLYGPGAAYAAARNHSKMSFIMGQLMVFSREALEAAGGLECAEGQLVDDMYIGRCLVEAGYANVMAKHTLPIITDGLSFGRFLKVYRRWLLFARNGLNLAFVWPMIWRGVAFFAAIFVTIAAAVIGTPWAAFAALAALLIQDMSAETLQRRLGGSPTPLRYRWMYGALLITAPAILVSMGWSGLDWRGREYRLGAQAKLDLNRNRPAEMFSRWAEAVGARIRRS